MEYPGTVTLNCANPKSRGLHGSRSSNDIIRMVSLLESVRASFTDRLTPMNKRW